MSIAIARMTVAPARSRSFVVQARALCLSLRPPRRNGMVVSPFRVGPPPMVATAVGRRVDFRHRLGDCPVTIPSVGR